MDSRIIPASNVVAVCVASVQIFRFRLKIYSLDERTRSAGDFDIVVLISGLHPSTGSTDARGDLTMLSTLVLRFDTVEFH